MLTCCLTVGFSGDSSGEGNRTAKHPSCDADLPADEPHTRSREAGGKHDRQHCRNLLSVALGQIDAGTSDFAPLCRCQTGQP